MWLKNSNLIGCRATENPSESGGTFDASGAFHGSDEEFHDKNAARIHNNNKKDSTPLQKSASQQNITSPKKPAPLSTSQSAINLTKKTEEPKDENEKEPEEKKPSVEPEKEIIKEEKKEEKIEKPQVHAKKIEIEVDKNKSNGLQEQKNLPQNVPYVKYS